MRLSTFLLVMGSMFVLITSSCAAMGMSFGAGGSTSSAASGGGGARSPAPPGKDVAKPTPVCAADIRRQGLPASLSPEGQSKLTKLTPRSHNVKAQIEEKFPGEYKSIGGYRSKPSQYSKDHWCGRAVDVMVTKLGKKASDEQIENGFAIAEWARKNADVLGVRYIIFQQCIWNVDMPTASGCGNVPSGLDTDGWRSMPNREGNTLNHYDHVHISMW